MNNVPFIVIGIIIIILIIIIIVTTFVTNYLLGSRNKCIEGSSFSGEGTETSNKNCKCIDKRAVFFNDRCVVCPTGSSVNITPNNINNTPFEYCRCETGKQWDYTTGACTTIV